MSLGDTRADGGILGGPSPVSAGPRNASLYSWANYPAAFFPSGAFSLTAEGGTPWLHVRGDYGRPGDQGLGGDSVAWETDEEPGGGARGPGLGLAGAGSLQGPLGLCVHTPATHPHLPRQGARQDPKDEFLSAEAASGSWREPPQAAPASSTRGGGLRIPHGHAL